MNVNEEAMFKTALSLVGRDVIIAERSSGKEYHGKIINAMFDSLILRIASANHIIRFDDIYYLEPRHS